MFLFCFKFPVFRCCLLTSCKADGLASSVPFCRDFWPDAPLFAARRRRGALGGGVGHFGSIPCASCLGFPCSWWCVSDTALGRRSLPLCLPLRVLWGPHHGGVQSLLEPAHLLLSASSHPRSPWGARASDPGVSLPLSLLDLLVPDPRGCSVLVYAVILVA